MANKQILKQSITKRRAARVRAKISGTAGRPRLSIFRSLKHVYAQLIDDEHGKTLVFASEAELKNAKGKKVDLALQVGELVAKKATAAGITTVVFDKSHYKFHGRIKAVAEGARQGGLKF